MAYLIGIDEAGYGPNLGPLVIGATLWQVPDGKNDLYQLLGDLFCRPGNTPETGNDGPADCLPLVVGDSKQIYRSGPGLGSLERPVGALLTGLGLWRDSAAGLFEVLAGIDSETLAAEPGYDWDAAAAPVAVTKQEIGLTSRRMLGAFDRSECSCRALEATVVFPADWNRGLRHFGNKASFLSAMSCRLVRRMLDVTGSLPDAGREPVTVLCDRHGGRAYYAALVQGEITPQFVRVKSETRNRSVYEWREECGQPVQINFLTRGEEEMPIALSSMLAKYLRELAMIAWNRFWQNRLEDLRPTAGYPGDSRRFQQEIAQVRKSLAIRTREIWRTR